MMIWQKRLLFAMILALLPAADGFGRSAAVQEKRSSGYDQALLEQINKYRKKNGLNQLRLDPALAKLAREHSKMMSRSRRMSHNNFDARFQQAGSRLCVENVGWNYALPEELFEGWRRSNSHNRNMLKKGLNRAGIAETDRYVTFFACK